MGTTFTDKPVNFQLCKFSGLKRVSVFQIPLHYATKMSSYILVMFAIPSMHMVQRRA